jgi:sensor histidine kinase YesM
MTDGIIIGIIGSLAYLARVGIRRRQEDALLKQEKTDLEMQALKSRLNPHFLFNTLNNIYYLSRQKRDEAPEAVLLLAETMRYMLDASAKETVPLTEEVKAADQILELIKYRVAPSFSVHLTSNIVVNHPIMPTIILTLVENAMKHGDLSDDGFIHIKVQTTDEYILIKSINRVRPEGKSLEVQSGKFGLSSLKRSLELVYPQQHTFESKRVDNQFEVAIELHAI